MDDIPSSSISTDTQGPYEVDDIEIPYYVTEIDIRNNAIQRTMRQDFPEAIDSKLMLSHEASGEEVAAEFYRTQEYQALKVSKGTTFANLAQQGEIPDTLLDELEMRLLNEYDRTYLPDRHDPDEFFDAFEYPLSFVENSGIPDLLVFRECDGDPVEFFFSEVKFNGDSLRRTQIEWLFEFDCYPARIIYIDQQSPHEPLLG
jgi:hypothetical protein